MKQTSQITLYLRLMKQFVRVNGYIMVEREQSLEFLAERGMTTEDVANIIFALTPADCFDGPEPDRDPRYSKWTVAEFNPTFNGETLYLKTSIKIDAERCKCLSIKLFCERGAVHG